MRRDRRAGRGARRGGLAVVAPKPGVERDQLKARAGERLAAFKVPTRFEIRPELPKTPTGKISKPPLREEFGSWALAAKRS